MDFINYKFAVTIDFSLKLINCVPNPRTQLTLAFVIYFQHVVHE